jgi:hypothetical protein
MCPLPWMPVSIRPATRRTAGIVVSAARPARPAFRVPATEAPLHSSKPMPEGEPGDQSEASGPVARTARGGSWLQMATYGPQHTPPQSETGTQVPPD